MPLTLLRDPELRLLDRPTRAPAPHEVVVDVAWAAVCRTDLLVADGVIAVEGPRVLGHEGSGVIASGPEAGRRVGFRPLVPCGQCWSCRAGDSGRCPAARQLGLDDDGCFAEQIVLSRSRLLPIADTLSLRAAVMIEPLAAAMGVLDRLDEAGAGPVWVPGEDRFAVLVRRVLTVAGRPWSSGSPDRPCAIAVDTLPLPELVEALAPGGTLLLRARAPGVTLPLTRVVQKGLRLVGCPHAPLELALAWLSNGRIEVEDLLEAPCALGLGALDLARRSRGKVLIRIGGQD